MSFKLKKGAIIHFADTPRLPDGPYKTFCQNTENTLKNNPHGASYIGFQVQKVFYDEHNKIQYEIIAIEAGKSVPVEARLQ